MIRACKYSAQRYSYVGARHTAYCVPADRTLAGDQVFKVHTILGSCDGPLIPFRFSITHQR